MKIQFTHFALAGCLAIFSGLLGAPPCLGQGTLYFDRNEFDLAIGGLAGTRRDVNFQPPLPPGGIDQGGVVVYFGPLTVSGLTFRPGVLTIRTSFDGNRWLNNYDSPDPLAVDMNGPAVAFGADFASLLSPVYSDFLATVTLDNGNVFPFTAPADPNFTFFGFVTTQTFSRVTFSDGGILFGQYHEEILDNITAVTVPEPGMFALFASGALLLGWRFLRKGARTT